MSAQPQKIQKKIIIIKFLIKLWVVNSKIVQKLAGKPLFWKIKKVIKDLKKKGCEKKKSLSKYFPNGMMHNSISFAKQTLKFVVNESYGHTLQYKTLKVNCKVKKALLINILWFFRTFVVLQNLKKIITQKSTKNKSKNK